MNKINILGVEYNIFQSNRSEDPALENCDGYYDHSSKTVVIDTFIPATGALKDLDDYKKQVIRHELVHAFLYESGLSASSWGNNEEIVDWIAIQFPKLLKAFQDAEAL